MAFGKLIPAATAALSRFEFGQGSQVNVPIGVLLWRMIYPMMLKVHFSAINSTDLTLLPRSRSSRRRHRIVACL